MLDWIVLSTIPIAIVALLGALASLFLRRAPKVPALLFEHGPPVLIRSDASEQAGHKMLNALRETAGDGEVIFLPNPLRQRR